MHFTVEINLDAIRVNVCVQYMLTIIDFFARPLAEFEGSEKSPMSTKDSGVCVSDVVPPQPLPNDVLTSVSLVTMVRARFKQLEVVLFAEPTNKHSRVLVLKVCEQPL